jgi:WD40 repeat protein
MAASSSMQAFNTETVVSGWTDGFVRCYFASNGQLAWQTANSHRGAVTAVCVVDQFVITGGEDNYIRLWNRRTHELLAQFGEHTKPISSVLQDCRPGKSHMVYSIGIDRNLYGYDLTKERRVLHHSYPDSGAFLGATQRRDHEAEMLLATQDGRVLQFDEDIPQPTYSFSASSSNNLSVRTISLSPASGKYLATGGDDGILRVWRVPTNQTGPFTVVAAIESAHSLSITSVSWSPDERQIISVGQDGAICVWNVYQ